jgi:hypothetical protein
MSLKGGSIKNNSSGGSDDEKNHDYGQGVLESYDTDGEENEVFKKNTDGVHFRTVSWPMASVTFLKS